MPLAKAKTITFDERAAAGRRLFALENPCCTCCKRKVNALMGWYGEKLCMVCLVLLQAGQERKNITRAVYRMARKLGM